MKTLAQYLKDNQSAPGHTLRAAYHASGAITFYIHPEGVDGDTLDFMVLGGNSLIPLQIETGGAFMLLSPEEALRDFLDMGVR